MIRYSKKNKLNIVNEELKRLKTLWEIARKGRHFRAAILTLKFRDFNEKTE